MYFLIYMLYLKFIYLFMYLYIIKLIFLILSRKFLIEINIVFELMMFIIFKFVIKVKYN